MFCTAFRRETQHGNTRFCETCHRLGGLCRTYGNLTQLGSIGHRRYSHIADYKNTILTILFLFRNQQKTTADTGDTWRTLNNLQGRTQGIACRGECTADLSISTLCLDNHTTQIQRVLHQLTSLLDGHTLALADLSQFLGKFLTPFVVLRVDEGCLVDVGQSLLLRQCIYLLRVTNKNNVCHILSQHSIGCTKRTFLFCFREYYALLVCLCTRNDLT